jgi:hypothetical protein
LDFFLPEVLLREHHCIAKRLTAGQKRGTSTQAAKFVGGFQLLRER